MSVTARQGIFALLAVGIALAGRAAQADSAAREFELIPGASAAPLAEPDIRRDELEAFIDGVMAAQFAARDLAGAAIIIVKDGEILLEKGYGFSNLEQRVPVDPAVTRFSVGSISKLMVWTAVMQLVERGQLDLDIDINRYLTTFKVPDTFAAPITMRNLLTHTAGFEDIGAPFAPDVFRAYASLGDFLAEHLPARVMSPARDFAHASRPYSNWGALLAAHVVECVSGESFRDYAARHIFRPLGMSRSDFAAIDAPAADQLALGYVGRNGAMVGIREDMSSSGPAGALQTTVDDIGRFMLAHLEGGALGSARILGQRTVETMHRRSAQASPWLDGMALGFMDAAMNGRRVLRHDGSTRFTHSELMLVPASNLGLFVTYNSRDGGYARRELRQAFVDRYLPADRPVLSAPADFAKRAAEFAGSYRSLRRSFTTFEKLMGSWPITVKPLPNRTLLIANDQWTEVAPDTFQNADGERIVFEREHGRVAALDFKSSLIPARRIHWYQDPRYHGLALLLVLASAAAMLAGAIRRARARDTAPRSVVRMRRVLAVIGLLNIVVVILLGSVFAGGIAPIMTSGIPTRLSVGLTLALGSTLLTLVALVLAVMMVRDRARPRGAAVWPLIHTVIAVAFVGLLQYWNLLGFMFG